MAAIRPDGILDALAAELRRPRRGAVQRVLATWMARDGAGVTGAAWLGRTRAVWGALAGVGDGAASEPPEPPDGLAWDALATLSPGGSLLLRGSALRSRPALVGRGVAEAVIAVGASGRRALWLDAGASEFLRLDWVQPALELLEGLEGAVELEELRLQSQGLEARARTALAGSHDLRNQIALALLHLERVALDPEHGTEPLRAALLGALALARAPLDGEVVADSYGKKRGAHEGSVFDLRPLLRTELQAAAALAARGRSVRLTLHCPGALATRGRELELRRWVRNGALNALRASRAGGCVRIMGEAVPGGGVRISIEDEGRGMADPEAEALFRPGASDSGGTGHGTTVLIECARALGAEMVLETGLGLGTCLRVELPGKQPF